MDACTDRMSDANGNRSNVAWYHNGQHTWACEGGVVGWGPLDLEVLLAAHEAPAASLQSVCECVLTPNHMTAAVRGVCMYTHYDT